MAQALALAACGGSATPSPAPPVTPGATPTTAAVATPTAATETTQATAEATPESTPPATAEATPAETPAETAGASPSPSPTPAPTVPEGAIEINFWSWVPGMQDQVNAWNNANPTIFVNYINKGAGNGEYAALKTALEANSDVPDVVQIEYQHIQSFISRGDLSDLVALGANDVKDQFVPWTWAQVSQGDGVYAYPQDAGPMIMMCNQKLLDKEGIKAPTTWDEFNTAAAALHKKDTNAYLSNFTADQGHFFGLLWQSGARPFKIDGQNINIDFTSPEVTRVAKLWGDLIKSGNLAPVDTYTPDWQTAIGNGTIACWTAGAWGPEVIEPAAPDLSGDWKIYLMPQWTAGDKVNGNYGGSAIAVTKASTHQTEAEAFNRWLNTDKVPALGLANGAAGLFPVTEATLSDPAWSDFSSPFWGGQKTHQITAKAAEQVDVSFSWSPFTDFVYTTYATELTNITAGTITFEQGMADLQAQTVAYATDQGFTVVAP
jgi:multiple sugar transport system substrate-binding protein